MQFDLKRFFQNGQKPYKAELKCELGGYDWPGYQPQQPVRAVFVAVPTLQGVELELSVSAVVNAQCARCLEPMEQEFSFKREWMLRMEELESEELELPISENGQLDLDELVYEELILEVPSVLLCSVDCQGLCPVCGKPKAAGCTCCTADSVDAPADERLAILKQLLNE